MASTHGNASPDDPLQPLWQGRALVWALLVAEALALVLALAPGLGRDRAVYFGLASLAAMWIAALTLGALYLLRPRLRGWPLPRVAWVGFALLMASTWCVGLAARWLLGPLLWAYSGQGFAATMLCVSAIVATVGLLSLAGLQNYWRAQRMAARARQAELEALHARIHPHFLFNTLNTAVALVRQRPGAAEQILLDLCDLFRVALSAPHEVPLASELELTRRYLDIERLRLGDRLAVDWQVPEALPELTVPALSIQPLVENAVRHGIEHRADGGRIELRVTVDPHAVAVSVRNPLPPPGVAVHGHRIGQSAVRARLQASHPQADLQTASDAAGYQAVVTFPRSPGDQASTR